MTSEIKPFFGPVTNEMGGPLCSEMSGPVTCVIDTNKSLTKPLTKGG